MAHRKFKKKMQTFKDKKTKSIEDIVLKCFIRVIKDDGKYMLFRRGVNNEDCVLKYFVKKVYGPFSSCKTSGDIANVLRGISNEMARNNGIERGVNGMDKYELVTMTINHLLHFFMEANGVPMQCLTKLGESTYNMSCNLLFGDEMDYSILFSEPDNSERQPSPTKSVSSNNVGVRLGLSLSDIENAAHNRQNGFIDGLNAWI